MNVKNLSGQYYYVAPRLSRHIPPAAGLFSGGTSSHSATVLAFDGCWRRGLTLPSSLATGQSLPANPAAAAAVSVDIYWGYERTVTNPEVGANP